MQNILYKTTLSQNAGSLTQYLSNTGIKVIVEDFEKDLSVAENFECCILTINFENESELTLAREFMALNRHLKFCAYVIDGSREAIVNAHKLGCMKLVSKPEDLKELMQSSYKVKSPNSEKTNKRYAEFVDLRVLIVDDVEVNLKLLTEILAPFKFEIHSYMDSVGASETLEQFKYDLILTDAVMPKINGFELARIAKNSELNYDTPCAFISGYTQAENKIESYNLGSVAFIEKPLEPATVRAQIYSILKIRQLQVEIVRQKENFIAMLTHDLKTPIRAQISALNLLLSGNFGQMEGEQTEILNEIMASNKYMQNMTDNVLLKYKSENGQLQMQKDKHNIKDTIESSISKLKYLISQKKQTLKVSYDLEASEAYYDEIEIERVLTNLVVNAVEYSPECAQIGVFVQGEGDKIAVSIEDSGCGIAEDELKIITEKYVSRAKEYKKIGTGLGLYICKKIITSHGGDISVRKVQSGTGSRFTFTLARASQYESKVS